MKRTVFFLIGVVLVACAPRQTSPYQQTPLPSNVTTELLRSFDADFQNRGVRVTRAAGQRTQPNTDDALLYVVQQFKSGINGYCLLEQSSFATDATGRRFLTLFARERDVMALIYDRTNPQSIISATVVGTTETPLVVKLCR